MSVNNDPPRSLSVNSGASAPNKPNNGSSNSILFQMFSCTVNSRDETLNMLSRGYCSRKHGDEGIPTTNPTFMACMKEQYDLLRSLYDAP